MSAASRAESSQSMTKSSMRRQPARSKCRPWPRNPSLLNLRQLHSRSPISQMSNQNLRSSKLYRLKLPRNLLPPTRLATTGMRKLPTRSQPQSRWTNSMPQWTPLLSGRTQTGRSRPRTPTTCSTRRSARSPTPSSARSRKQPQLPRATQVTMP